VRDLTGLDLRPAREFPIDGAAGEGFTNTGDALVMSPALLGKYLDAAKEIAGHAVLLPDGFRFSPKSTRRDWTDEIIAEIRRFYDSYADAEGKIPLEPYLAATISLREATAAGKAIDVDRLASERRLNARYLRSLWALFHEGRPGDDRFLDGLRARWKATRSGEVSALAAEIRGWQASVWRFNAVGHAFLTPWQEPVSPVVGAVALRLPLTPAAGSDEIVATLTAGDSGDGAAGDFVLWRQPRLEMTGRPPILLEDIRAISEYLLVERPRMLGMTAGYLAAATTRRSPRWPRNQASIRSRFPPGSITSGLPPGLPCGSKGISARKSPTAADATSSAAGANPRRPTWSRIRPTRRRGSRV
jgi:hypothetical protein